MGSGSGEMSFQLCKAKLESDYVQNAPGAMICVLRKLHCIMYFKCNTYLLDYYEKNNSVFYSCILLQSTASKQLKHFSSTRLFEYHYHKYFLHGNIVDAVFHRENYLYGQSLQMTARMEFTLYVGHLHKIYPNLFSLLSETSFTFLKEHQIC